MIVGKGAERETLYRRYRGANKYNVIYLLMTSDHGYMLN